MNSTNSPTILVIGGPNGAGKTTLTPALLRRSPEISVFLNADSIARALTGRTNNNAAYLAGRIMLERMEALVSQKSSFGLESTLSGKTLAASLQRYQRQGYRVEVVYITFRKTANSSSSSPRIFRSTKTHSPKCNSAIRHLRTRR